MCGWSVMREIYGKTEEESTFIRKERILKRIANIILSDVLKCADCVCWCQHFVPFPSFIYVDNIVAFVLAAGVCGS